MNRLLHDIERLAMVALLPLLLALAPAMAQNIVYQNSTTTLSVVQVPGDNYEWELYSDGTVNFATVPGNCPPASANFVGGNIGASVNVKWSAVGTYFFKVTARDAIGCTNNLKIGIVKVIPPDVKAVIAGVTQAGACQQVSLDASKSTGANLKYEWSILDQGGALTNKTGVTTEFLLSPSYTGSLPADFRVRLVVTDITGNTGSDTITINVDRLPVAELYSAGKLDKDGSMIVDAVVTAGTPVNYRWYTSEGKVVGPDNQPSAKLFGAGIYSLEITDHLGCKITKDFKFPIEIYQIIANPDYVRTSWAQDTTINVLVNDNSNSNLVPGSVHITELPTLGTTRINPDGSITYVPKERRPGRDQLVYEVCNDVNLCASAKVTIDIYDSNITLPNGFSPNGDGVNEQLIFNGLENYPESQLYVYTRSGQLVYQSLNYQNDWDGTSITNKMTNLKLVPTGTYYYILKLGGTNRTIKGFVYVGY